MKSKEISKQKMAMVDLILLVLALALLLIFFPHGIDLPAIFARQKVEQTQNNLVPPIEKMVFSPQPPQIVVGLPLRLKIPSINVDAAVEDVSIMSNGEMGVPKGATGVAWFELGPRPGEIGSAVIAGHYGHWLAGGGSVFDDLNKLIKGDKVYIEDDKGAAISFIVRESRMYDPKADDTNVFVSNDGKAHLNLVTCEGIWDENSQGYPKRLVVFTDKE